VSLSGKDIERVSADLRWPDCKEEKMGRNCVLKFQGANKRQRLIGLQCSVFSREAMFTVCPCRVLEHGQVWRRYNRNLTTLAVLISDFVSLHDFFARKSWDVEPEGTCLIIYTRKGKCFRLWFIF
jgi:hypothetical protein